jgi:protein gp37
MRMARRSDVPDGAYEGLTRIGKRGVDWAGWARFIPEQVDAPLRWRKPRLVFVNSMSDLFHESLSNEQIAAVFGIMSSSPWHRFQVLTKRAARMREWFDWVQKRPTHLVTRAAPWPNLTCVVEAQRVLESIGRDRHLTVGQGQPWPLPNVWLGVSAEDQKRANDRVAHLLATPAAVRFVSAEPLLGPIDFTDLVRWDNGEHHFDALACDVAPEDDDPAWRGAKLDWVIAGAESGHGARPMHEDWIRSLRDQCERACARFFYKQKLDEHGRKVSLPLLDGRKYAEMPGVHMLVVAS